MDSSFYLSLLDEISLEGLRGITFESLWIRLQERDQFLIKLGKVPLFQLKQNDILQDLVFQIILKEAQKANIQFYKLHTSRKKLSIYDRNKYFVPETGTLIMDDSQIPDDLNAPIVPIKDDDNIKGSCEDFKTRIDITEEVLKKSQINTFKEFKKIYKINQIVIVASQKLRAISLFGNDRWQECFEMKSEQYVILESIGSKRWYGEMNFGKEAPNHQDSKIKSSYHYLRKFLITKKLIFHLFTSVYLKKRGQISLVSISYLPRFRPNMMHQNDGKIIELSKLFIQSGKSKLPLSKLKDILQEFNVSCSNLKKVRNFLSRYSFILKIYGENRNDAIVEYLKPLDRILDFDDLYQAGENGKLIEVEEEPKNKSIKKYDKTNQSIESDEDTEENAEDNEDDQNKTEDLDLEDFDDDLDWEINSSEKIKWDDLGLEDIEEKPMDEDFDYDTFFNVKNSLKQKKIEQIINYPQEDSSVKKCNLIQNECHEIVSKIRKLKLEIFDRKLENLFKIYPKRKCIKTRDGEMMDISLLKIQQIRYLKERFYWLLNQIGKTSRSKLVRLFDLPITTIRNLIIYWQKTNDISYSVQYIGRQSIYQFETTFMDSTSTASTANNNERLLIRIEIILEFLRDVRFFDSLTWIRSYVAQREINLGVLVDNKSIMRILNQLVDMGKVKVYHYCFLCGLHFRNAFFIVLDNQVSCIDLIVEHLILRTLFFFFGRFSIDLKKDIEIRSMLRDDGKFKLITDVNNWLIENSKKPKNNIEPEVYAAYRPAMATHLYGCHSSKIEKMFEFYKFLFYLLVPNYDSQKQYSPYEWQSHVPKLDNILTNHQFSIIDIMPYIPLTILRNVVTLRYEVPGLDECLKDPIARNLMLHELSPKIRSHLLYNRKVNIELQELAMSLTYFQLLTLVEKVIKDKKYIYRYRFVLNTRIEVKQKLTNSSIEYIFRTISDFDQFTEMVYNHLFNKPTSKCSDCPFDSRLNLHSIHFTSSAAKKFIREENYDEKINDTHRKKRKQNLKPLKNKRIKLEMFDSQAKKNKKSNKITNQSSKHRVSWSREEDNFLLKCRLVSMLMNTPPIYRFAVSVDVICQLLHSYVGSIANNKSPLACARRILRLYGKPSIKRVLNISILELKSIGLNLCEEEIEDKNDSQESPILRKFKRLLNQILSYRFVNTEFFMTRQELNTLNFLRIKTEEDLDLESLLSKFNIINPYLEKTAEYYFDPKNYYDIHSYVITNVLISSLISFRLHQQFLNSDSDCSKNENDPKYLKRYFMRTVFKALKHFPDTLVRLVLKRLTQFRFITHNKKNDTNDRKLQPYAYKLGNIFFHDLAIHHFTYGLKFNQKYQKDDHLFQTVVEDNNSVISAIEFGENLCVNVLGLNNSSLTHSEDLKKSSDLFGKNIQLYPPTLLESLRFQIDIPKNFICLSKEMLEENRRNSRGLLMNRNSKINEISVSTDIEENIDTSCSLIDDMSVIHCKVQMNQLSKSRQIFSNKISKFFSIHLQFFNANEFPLTETISSSSPSVSNLPKEDFDLRTEYLEKISLPLGVNRDFSEMIHFIRSKKELGTTLENLVDYLQCSENDQELVENLVKDFLFTCQINKLIFSVGIVTRSWVHRDFIRYWLVHSFKNLDFHVDHLLALDKSSFKKIRKVCFLPKLWKSPDGNLDINVLFLFLNRLIGFLIIEPGVGSDLNQIAEHFGQFLPKVQLIELIELLLAIDCVRTSILDIEDNQNIECLDDFFNSNFVCHQNVSQQKHIKKKKIIYEATIDAYSRLTSLHQMMQANPTFVGENLFQY